MNKCVMCGNEFIRTNSAQKTCGILCSDEREKERKQRYYLENQKIVIKICSLCHGEMRVPKSSRATLCPSCRKERVNPRVAIKALPPKQPKNKRETLVKKESIRSHSPEIQAAIDRFLAKGGLVRTYMDEVELSDYYKELLEEALTLNPDYESGNPS